MKGKRKRKAMVLLPNPLIQMAPSALTVISFMAPALTDKPTVVLVFVRYSQPLESSNINSYRSGRVMASCC